MGNQLDKQNNLEVTLENSQDEIIDAIVKETNPEKLQDLTSLFNQSLLKHSVIRAAKVSELLDKVNDEAEIRLTTEADSMSDKDLREYMNSFQTQLDKSNQYVDKVNQSPVVQLTQNNLTNINVDGENLSKESRDRILSVVQSVLKGSDGDDTK